ncbi:MAG TPA: sigma-70 family RNA polymerase sigma factor [Bryobacteraceae bacterium]|nr:sigma-70 family RNA polymerase sigma factor [Bryobacteraceae bacterium]
MHIDDAFIAEHLEGILRQIRRRVDNVEDARDLAQEVFVRALRHENQLRDRHKARHWLSRIASNVTIDFLRQRRENVHLDDIPTSSSCTCDHPEQMAEREQLRRLLNRALQQLTWRERCALLLRDLNDLGTDEVAAVMRCSQATVRSHAANARIKLRPLLRASAVSYKHQNAQMNGGQRFGSRDVAAIR